ncbi:MAG: DegT/DnrJ/EryC1/StrS family aminotransferase [Candidatus Deferrimicrobiota bacterium]
MQFVNLQAQFKAYEGEIRTQMEDVLQSARFILGPKGEELEKRLSEFTGSKHAFGCSSGTDALLLALMALEIRPRDEVITTPFTFIATAEAISLLGAVPVFVDIEPSTYNIDPRKITAAITDRTRAIVAVSLFGQCAPMEEIFAACGGRDIFVIEDACQSLGASRSGRMSCDFPSIGVTSFFPSKPLGCYGDGGMIFTSEDAVADRIKGLRNHGQWERYLHRAIGINGRLDEIQAAVLLAKLPHFNEELIVREEIGRRYNENLSDAVIIPATAPGNTHVYAQYSVRTHRRNELIHYLANDGIPTAIHYPLPLHLQEVYKHLGFPEGAFPEAEAASREILSLPMSAFLTRADQDEVIRRIRDYFGK